MKKTAFITLASALILSTNVAMAGDGHNRCHFDSGNSNMPGGFGNGIRTVTVADIKNNAKDDETVFLKGRLTKFLGDERFEFTDLKGDTIVVKLDDDHNWSNINKDMPIEIEAEVDKEFMDLKLEVRCARPDGGKTEPPANGPKGF